MRKKITTCICVFGFMAFSFAQQKKGDFELGFNIGYNTSSVSDSNGDSPSSLSGFNIGGAADYYFSNRWSLKGKLIYDQKGWEDQGFKFKTNYLTVPVMANYHFAKKRNWYLNFGPYVGFLLSAKEKETDTDVKDFVNSTDFGLAFGIGVKIPVSDKMKIFLEYDGQGGFTDINKNLYETDDSITTSRSSFNAGINFVLD